MKSWIEISAARLRANYTALGAASGPDFQLLCVIKADAYGHGAEDVALVLAAAGARWFGVSDLEEGIRVREVLNNSGWAGREGEDRRILVMSGFEPEDAPGLLAHGLTPVVWTTAHIDALESAASAANQRIAVHIEIDTGMARQGVCPGEDLDRLAHRLAASPWVRCEGIFSHLSSSEVASSPQTSAQEQRFQLALAHAFDIGLPEYIHLGNSSAVDEGSTLPWLKQATLYMGEQLLLRPGLALFGYVLPLQSDPIPHGRLALHLQPVATWKARILDLRDLAPGDTVGYGATFIAPHTMRVALLPVGYADGFRREASSGIGDGWVIINHQRAPVVGRVSMNLTVVDITTHTPEPAVGDEVILLGEGVTAHDHARWANTIPYEILCGVRGHRRLI